MRTTVNLDDDVYELASVYATARGITLGSALGELVRTSREESPQAFLSSIPIAANGLPIFPSRGRRLTPEMVKAAAEDDIG
jgi:hypothetical protein